MDMGFELSGVNDSTKFDASNLDIPRKVIER